jgi:tRNA dimethylallyltransferase
MMAGASTGTASMADENARIPATPRAVCLAGPTASGKTALALAFARERPIEVISVDSALVYRGLDIATAKPAAAERAAVPHHLIDLLDPAEAYSAARFASDANRLIDQIASRGRLPLLVGGTMLYFKALRDGLHAMPQADPTTRAAIDLRAAALGWPALHAELAAADPITAARLAPNDSQRIQRALEVWVTTGRALSAWHADAGVRPGANPLPMVSLEPASRAWLHARIAERFDAMLAAGLVDEVRALRARGDLHAGLPAVRCVGVRQAWAALETGDLSNLRDTGVAATRQLAKRQLTWLRSVPDRCVVPCDAPDATEQALTALRRAAGSP